MVLGRIDRQTLQRDERLDSETCFGLELALAASERVRCGELQ